MSDEANGIGWAVKQMQNGERVRRSGWNGKGMFLFLVPGSTFEVNRPPLLGIYEPGTVIDYHAHVDMKTATGEIVPWLCSQTDLLAADWEAASGPEAVSVINRACGDYIENPTVLRPRETADQRAWRTGWYW